MVPKILPNLPNLGIISGVAITKSKSSHPPWILLIYSSSPAKSAPAANALSIFSPLVIAKILTVLPVPFGNETVPLTCWSACLGSTPNLIANSTVSTNFALLVSKTKSNASSGV